MPSLKVATWNVEWATPASPRWRAISTSLFQEDPDICCITEGYLGGMPEGWHVISSDADYGYRQIPGRRKVYLASRTCWRDIDTLGVPSLPGGRFVSGMTTAAETDIRVVGVCIPWSHAHVSTGQKNRKAWQDHEAYLTGLGDFLARINIEGAPTVVLGDFNQTIPRRRAPVRMFSLLQDTLLNRFEAITAGLMDVDGRHTVDHIGISDKWSATDCKVLSRTSADGKKLSDHMGVVARLSVAD